MVQALGTDPARGLDAGAVAARRARHGANRLRTRAPRGIASILAHQFKGVIVWLLAGAAVLSFVLGDLVEGAAILVVLAINATIGFVTELRALRSMEALMSMARVATRVLRGGTPVTVDARDLVPGDVVLLEAGDVVTADLRLLAASNLQCDQSVLTGESVPVPKQVAPVAADAPPAARASMLFKGTAVTLGSGRAVVTATGMATELGRITNLVETAAPAATPLETRLDQLGHRLVWLTLGLAALTILAGALRGLDPALMFQTGVALAVAAVPEGLPVVATLSLARGLLRLSARNAAISDLASVETLGATTVILTDKTGTLTENRMQVVRYLFDGGEIDTDARARPPAPAQLAEALRIGVACNGATPPGPGQQASGDPMEVALLQAAQDHGAPELLRTACEPVAEYAFDPARRMMATFCAEEAGARYLAVKGAPEAVIEVCERVLDASGAERTLDAAAREEWLARARAAAAQGLRLLGLAMRRDGAGATDGTDGADDPYRGLTLVALACLRDPLRAEVPEAIAAARAAGVEVVMLTGDHPETAAAIARAAGLGEEGDRVIEERDIAGLDWDALAPEEVARLLAARVFARVSPETKLRLAKLYQSQGHIIAMTGDGVNDAPALKQADIGIAMGLRGTEVAREAARMVLRDDAFGTIIVAMRQGRVIFENIRKFVLYLMSCNVSEVLIVALAVASGLPLPLLPLQILFLNLVTDVFPALALGLGRGDAAIMREPPRTRGAPILDRARWISIAVLGAGITAATLLAFLLALEWLQLDTSRAVSVAFLTLSLGQLWNVFNLRLAGTSPIDNDVTRNPYVWGAILLCLVLVAAAFLVPGLAAVLHLPDPGGAGLALAGVASLLPLLVGQARIAFSGQSG